MCFPLVPCTPTNVTATYKCSPDLVPVSWAASNGAKYYTAVAESTSGYSARCTTNTTSCGLPGLQCGDVYTIRVSGADDNCLIDSDICCIYTPTEPCTPTNVSSLLICSAGSAQVSWAPSANALSYAVKATSAEQILNLTCQTTGTSCSLSDLQCEQTYNVSVKASSGSCTGPCSSPQTVKTVCALVFVGVDRQRVAVTDQGSPVTCNTTNTLCLLNGLQCGHIYNITVMAQNQASPCIPSNVTTYAQCMFTMGSVSWGPSDGAKTYTAEATGLDGDTYQCLTSTTSCSWTDLHCGEQYSVVVRANNDNCSSLPSNTSIIYMIVSLSWHANNGTKIYTVSADAKNQPTTFSTNVTTTDFSDLTCGQNYSLSVTPHILLLHTQTCHMTNPSCLSTVPCVPTNISLVMNCVSNTAAVSWSASRGALHYSVTAHSFYGNASCQSSDLSCTLYNLTCGSQYTVQVVAIGENCSSIPTPCPPENVSAQVSCLSNNMMVSWNASRDADRFSVSVISLDGGFSESCTSTSTSCSIGNVNCGNTFSVHVASSLGSCISQQSQTQSISSGMKTSNTTA
uniref:Fibronectin type-III domain-containing protein n=1 Tax=Anabas testudineus TaxID=64144 RepID=A0A7N6FH25_ANATE